MSIALAIATHGYICHCEQSGSLILGVSPEFKDIDVLSPRAASRAAIPPETELNDQVATTAKSKGRKMPAPKIKVDEVKPTKPPLKPKKASRPKKPKPGGC